MRKIATNNMRPLTKSLETFVCDHYYLLERGLCKVKEVHDQTMRKYVEFTKRQRGIIKSYN